MPTMIPQMNLVMNQTNHPKRQDVWVHSNTTDQSTLQSANTFNRKEEMVSSKKQTDTLPPWRPPVTTSEHYPSTGSCHCPPIKPECKPDTNTTGPSLCPPIRPTGSLPPCQPPAATPKQIGMSVSNDRIPLYATDESSKHTNSPDYLTNWLRTQIGKTITFTFLFGNTLIDKSGTLLDTSETCLLLCPSGTNDICLCDLQHIQFVNTNKSMQSSRRGR